MSSENEKIKNKKMTLNNEKKSESDSESDDLANEDDDSDKKQMFAGCCVCGDDSGFSNNLLVYCDGIDCKVAVHQGCYGILNVPDDSWYCGSCKHKIDITNSAIRQKNPNLNEHLSSEFDKIKCELCPVRDGALKRTHNGKWAHVVCALYIPEISFGSVKTMEPVILKDIKSERFNKKCSICEKCDTTDNSNGVYVNCYKPGCKHWFHVTCAQTKGLLCEENNSAYKNNVTYCIYCKIHLKKLLKSSDVIKQLPAFNLALCPPSDETNQNNTPQNVNSLIASINKSLKTTNSQLLIESDYKVKDCKKIKSDKEPKRKINLDPKTNKNNQQQQQIVEFSTEKKKKRFSFNAAAVVVAAPNGTKQTNNNNKETLSNNSKVKNEIKSTDSNNNNLKTNDIKSNIESSATLVEKSEIVKKSPSESMTKTDETLNTTTHNSLTELKPETSKTIDKIKPSKTELEVRPTTPKINKKQDDETSSIKSYRSTSTINSTSKRKSSTSLSSKHLKKPKSENEESADESTPLRKNELTLSLNIDETKLGIVTPSTSSCASSTTSNFPKSPEQITNQPKARIRNLIPKQKETIAECIDAFGNYLTKPNEQQTTNQTIQDNLEQLLTKQWDLGAELLNEATNKFDCMDLINLLYKCKQENQQLEIKLKNLQQKNDEYLNMNKKLSEKIETPTKPIPILATTNTSPPTTSTTTTNNNNNNNNTPKYSLSFTKVINDQVQNQIVNNSSSFNQPSTNSINYSSLIQSMNYFSNLPKQQQQHQPIPNHHQSSPQNSNSFFTLYKTMQAQSPNTQNGIFNPAMYQSSLHTQTQSPQKNNHSLNSILNQNQLLQQFQQLNPLQQQQISNFYYMANNNNNNINNAQTSTTMGTTPPVSNNFNP